MPNVKHPDLLNNVEYEWQDKCKELNENEVSHAFIKYCCGKVEREPKIIQTRAVSLSDSGIMHDGNAQLPEK